MKYLKLFEKHSQDYLITEIEDRINDLKDAGFNAIVFVNSDIFGGEDKYGFEIQHKDYFSIYEVVSEYLEHLERFMKSKGYLLSYSGIYQSDGLFCQTIYFKKKDSTIKLPGYTQWSEAIHVRESYLPTSNDVFEDVKDMCLELKDNGFTISDLLNGNKGHITIEKFTGEGHPLDFEYIGVISEVIDRIKEYLINQGATIVTNCMTTHYVWLDLDKYLGSSWPNWSEKKRGNICAVKIDFTL